MLDRLRRRFPSRRNSQMPNIPGMVDGIYPLPPNYIVDKLVEAAPYSILNSLKNVQLSRKYLTSQDYQSFLQRYMPDWQSFFSNNYHKKLLEFFASYSILDPQQSDVILDAAGGAYTYVHRLPCHKKYIQDIVIHEEITRRYGDGVDYIESNAAEIPLESHSIDKLSCHHSFEHFEANADINFIKEVQRLLAPGGICCIVPIFLANIFVEITNVVSLDYHFDSKSFFLIDPTASIPGYVGSTPYARVYDSEAFERRVLDMIDTSKFLVHIYELYLDGDLIPDLSTPDQMSVTGVNFPYRALMIQRIN